MRKFVVVIGISLAFSSLLLAETKDYFCKLSASTVDPLGLTVCKTTHKLQWSSDGEKILTVISENKTWGADPTFPVWPLNSHWKLQNRQTRKVANTDGGNDFCVDLLATYVNYDFGFRKKCTEVTHIIRIMAYADGTFEYDVAYQKSGEAKKLLRFKTKEHQGLSSTRYSRWVTEE